MRDEKNMPTVTDVLEELYRGPAYLIRRAQQIATAIFAETCEELDLTPSQYSMLFALRRCGPVGQNELGRLVSLDRCTTSVVVGILNDRGLVVRLEYPNDRRRTMLSLTNSGRLLLGRAERLSTRASDRLLSVLNNNQARTFVGLLEALVKSHEAKRPVAN